MKETTIDQTLVLCDLDSLLLDAAGNLPQLQRDVLQLFASRGGRLTVFSQRSPRAVRSLLGGVRLSAPALVCGGTLALCNFAKLIFLDGITPPVAAVVCLTLICTVILSQLIGGLLPVIAEKLNFDPAVMASPLITTIVDTTTLLVYFNIARTLLKI